MKLRFFSVALLTLALASSLVLVGCKKDAAPEAAETTGVEEAAPAPEAAAPVDAAAAPAADAAAAEGHADAAAVEAGAAEGHADAAAEHADAAKEATHH